MYELTVRDSFAAAHRLCNHPAKCRNLHGHTWKVEVSVKGPALDGSGMLIDFGYLKSSLKQTLERLDHTYLNEHPAFQGENPENNPTAENIACFIFKTMKAELSRYRPAAKISAVTVWESPSASVRYTEGD